MKSCLLVVAFVQVLPMPRSIYQITVTNDMNLWAPVSIVLKFQNDLTWIWLALRSEVLSGNEMHTRQATRDM